MNAARSIVRKRVEDDCLLDGELHPSIVERLQRIRELPVRGAANLHGVETDQGNTWLVWGFVPGMNLDQLLEHPQPREKLQGIARDLKHTVSAIHAQGIVHGALHARNVIIDSRGAVFVTHFSPLLWSDPADDQKSLHLLIERLLPRSSSGNAPAGEADDDRHARRRAKLLAWLTAGVAIVILIGILWYIRD